MKSPLKNSLLAFAAMFTLAATQAQAAQLTLQCRSEEDGLAQVTVRSSSSNYPLYQGVMQMPLSGVTVDFRVEARNIHRVGKTFLELGFFGVAISDATDVAYASTGGGMLLPRSAGKASLNVASNNVGDPEGILCLIESIK